MREGIYEGAINTTRITETQGSGNYAAFICAQYSGGGYGDWYLPAKGELNLLFQQKAMIDSTATANGGRGLATEWYWSSSEDFNFFACGQFFGDDDQGNFSKDLVNRVRAVRAF